MLTKDVFQPTINIAKNLHCMVLKKYGQFSSKLKYTYIRCNKIYMDTDIWKAVCLNLIKKTWKHRCTGKEIWTLFCHLNTKFLLCESGTFVGLQTSLKKYHKRYIFLYLEINIQSSNLLWCKICSTAHFGNAFNRKPNSQLFFPPMG